VHHTLRRVLLDKTFSSDVATITQYTTMPQATGSCRQVVR